MTPTEVELVREGFEALAEGGVDALLARVHPEFEMETLPGIAAEPQAYRGREGVRRWFESFYEVMDEVAIEPSSYQALDPDRVLIQFRLRARGQTSGIEVEQEARAIATLRDDLMIRLEFLLPEEPAPAPAG